MSAAAVQSSMYFADAGRRGHCTVRVGWSGADRRTVQVYPQHRIPVFESEQIVLRQQLAFRVCRPPRSTAGARFQLMGPLILLKSSFGSDRVARALFFPVLGRNVQAGTHTRPTDRISALEIVTGIDRLVVNVEPGTAPGVVS